MADCKTETWTLEEIRESLEKEKQMAIKKL